MPRPLAFFYRRRQLSGIIRAQMAGPLGAALNPRSLEPGTVCIGVKMLPGAIARDKLILPEQMGDYYLDLIDLATNFGYLSRHPETKVIVCSRSGLQWMQARLPNPLYCPPQ